MYFLVKDPDGSHRLNKAGQQLMNQFYKPPKQHGKKNLKKWQDLTRINQGKVSYQSGNNQEEL